MASTSSEDINFDVELSELNQEKLPTNLQVLQHLLFFTRHSEPRYEVDDASTLVTDNVTSIWSKSGIKTQDKRNIKTKIKNLYSEQRIYQKARIKSRTRLFEKASEIFDVSHDEVRESIHNFKESALLSQLINEIAKHMQNLQLLNTSGVLRTSDIICIKIFNA